MSKVIDAKVVFRKGVERVQIEFDSHINRIGNITKNPDIYLDDDQLLFPCFIDIHTHCREDSSQLNSYKEDFHSASLAALNGGVGYIADMPNNPCAPTNEIRYMQKSALKDQSLIPVMLYGGINSHSNPFMFAAPYKYFLSSTTDTDCQSQIEILEKYEGQWVSFHCEDESLFQDADTHSKRRPVESEVASIKKAIELIKKYGLKGIICHISTKEGMKECIKAKREGVTLLVEVTLHHLVFNTDLTSDNVLYQVNPPIRSRAHQEYLLNALRQGDIDFLVSDHAPHLFEEKINGLSGLAGLDAFGLVVGELIHSHKVDPTEILKVACINPANWLTNFTENKYGEILIGNRAIFTVLNFANEYIQDNKMIKTKCGWSVYDSHIFPASVAVIGS